MACQVHRQSVWKQLPKKTLGKEMGVLAPGRWLEHIEVLRVKDMRRVLAVSAEVGPCVSEATLPITQSQPKAGLEDLSALPLKRKSMRR